MFWGYFLIVLSAISFGIIPILTLYAYDYGVNTTTLLFLRFTFASIIFFLYVFLKVKKWRITKKQLVSLLLLGGVLYMLQSSFYFSSVKYIPASLAALLLYLYPIFVAILSFFFNKEKLSKQLLMAISLSLIGIILVLGSPIETVNLVGIFLAVGAAVVYSVYIVIGDRVIKQLPPMMISAFISLFSSISFLIGGTFTHRLSLDFGIKGWLVILGVACICSVVAMFTFFTGMDIIGPTKASILSMVEPVVTIILSTLLFQEKMSAVQMLGGMIVLSGTILVVLAREKKQLSIEVYPSKLS